MKNKSAILSLLHVGVLLLFLFSCKKEEPSTIPTITIVSITDITPTSATSGGEITSDGGAAATARGVCWSISQNPTITDNKTSNGSGSGRFTSSITGLVAGVTYYIKAYAVNAVGTAYSSQATFNALALLPILTTVSVSETTSTSAISGGNITSDGGAPITARGVCWATTSSPTINNSKTTDGTGTGSFTSTIATLNQLTTYYIRAYATNSAGTAYGNEQTVKTLEKIPTIPTYKTTSQYNSKGNRIEEVKYKWDINTKDWINFSKMTYSYDSQGYKTQSIYSNWDAPSQKWINGIKDTFSYLAFGIRWIDVEYLWDTTAEIWREYRKHGDYGVDNKYSFLYVTYYYHLVYSWKEEKRYTYDLRFDINGRIREQIISYFDGAWLKTFYTERSIFTYDSKGIVIDTERDTGGGDYGWISSGIFTSFTFDNNRNPIEKLSKESDSKSGEYIYIIISKIIYTYDSNGYQTEYIEYTN